MGKRVVVQLTIEGWRGGGVRQGSASSFARTRAAYLPKALLPISAFYASAQVLETGVSREKKHTTTVEICNHETNTCSIIAVHIYKDLSQRRKQSLDRIAQ